jgi:hypothetical protein
MQALVEQIESSLASRLYFLSLFSCLSVPDIGGALASENGEASGKKFAQWYEAWIRPRYRENVVASLPENIRGSIGELNNPLDGESCYQFRCSLLHQGSTQHPKSKFERIMFIEPGATTNVIHYSRINEALCIDLPSFCTEVLQGARKFLAEEKENLNVRRNMLHFVQRYPEGLTPYIGGVPVIS